MRIVITTVRADTSVGPYTLISNFDSERGLRGREARDRHAVRRHADVVEPHLLEEMDRRRVAPVLAADAELEILPRLASELDRRLHHLADTLDVDGRERI